MVSGADTGAICSQRDKPEIGCRSDVPHNPVENASQKASWVSSIPVCPGPIFDILKVICRIVRISAFSSAFSAGQNAE